MKIKEKIYESVTHAGINLLARVFPEYFGKEPLAPTDRHIEYPWVIKNLPEPPAHILDVGCIGMLPLLLKAMKYEVWGIDLRQHHYADEFIFLKKDICKDVDINEFLDCITAVSTIEHIKDDQKAIDNIHKYLKPQGSFLMTVPFGKAKQTRFHRIYDIDSLVKLLKNFEKDIKIVDSPQEGQIALIKGVKDDNLMA